MSDRPPADPPTWQAVMLDGLMEAYAAARTNGDPFDFTASSFNLESELASCYEQWLKLREAPAPKLPAPKCEDCHHVEFINESVVCVTPEMHWPYPRSAFCGESAPARRKNPLDACGPEGRLFEAAK